MTFSASSKKDSPEPVHIDFFLKSLRQNSVASIYLDEKKVLLDDKFELSATELKAIWNDGHFTPEILSALNENTSLKEVKCIGFTKKNQETVAKSLAHKTLNKITLYDYEKLTPEGKDSFDLSIIANCLTTQPSLTSIVLGKKHHGAPFTAEHAKHFVSLILKHENLVVFDISHTDWDEPWESKSDNSTREKLVGDFFVSSLKNRILNRNFSTGINNLLLYPLTAIQIPISRFYEKTEWGESSFNDEVNSLVRNFYEQLNAAKAYPDRDQPGLLSKLIKEDKIRFSSKAQKCKFIAEMDNDAISHVFSLSFSKFSEFKIRKHSLNVQQEDNIFELSFFYIVFTQESSSGKTKDYFLLKENPESDLYQDYCWLLRYMLPDALEVTYQQSHRLSAEIISLDYWDSIWDSITITRYFYNYIVDCMMLNVIDEIFNRDLDHKIENITKRITIYEIGGGKARFAHKLSEYFVKKGYEVSYYMCEPAPKQALLAKQRLTAFQQKHSDKLKFQVEEKKFGDSDVAKLEGSVDLVVAEGVFTTDVTTCESHPKESSLDAKKYLTHIETADNPNTQSQFKKAVSLLKPGGIIGIAGLRHFLWNSKYIKKCNMTLLRQSYRFENAFGLVVNRQCYFAKKNFPSATEGVKESIMKLTK